MRHHHAYSYCVFHLAVDCGIPVLPAGITAENPVSTTYDSSVVCVCSSGYESIMVISVTISCSATGLWNTLSLIALICNRKCLLFSYFGVPFVVNFKVYDS